MVDAVRDAAVDVLLRVFEHGARLDQSLDKTLKRRAMSDRGRRFLTQLVYGTVRHKILCDHVLQKLSHQALEKYPPPILVVLRMGVYQALFMNSVTFPAMVHTSVELAKKRGHAGLAKVANAVLRKAPTCMEEVALPDRTQHLDRYLSVRYSMPLWIVRQWTTTYGAHETERLCEWASQEAPPTLRVNTMKTTPGRMQETLARKGILTAKATPVPEELTVVDGHGLLHTDAFRQGLFFVQDPASMLPPHLLSPRPGERVLDLSAAPGGKTTHMAQLSNGEARIVAADVARYKLPLIAENAARLGLPSPAILCANGEHAPFARSFDAVLLDAPCSGWGTFRRHPDLKYRTEEAAIGRLAAQQQALLRSAVQCARPGGRVVYSVCTFTPQETTGVVDAILREGKAALEDGPELLNSWRIQKGQYQTHPGREGLDGFFLTRLRVLS
jgi:16S rRNA (cytosine967-C5)-methyltransferase